MMARMALDPEQIKEEGRPVTVCDPCCGSGGMVLACAQPLTPDHIDLLRVTLQDINPVACDMAYINTTLWGIPAEVILGNSLTVEVVNRWTNIHWHRVGEPQRKQGLRMLKVIKEVCEPSKPETPAQRRPAPPDQGTGSQLDLF